ncbi:MAG: BPSS1780 family membrane protein [Pseudomonadota bacterium]
MQPVRVDARRGYEWFRGGIALVGNNPLPLGVIALLFGIATSVLSLLPVLGLLATVLLVPVLGGGYMVALHEEHEGRGAQIEHLFRGFQDQDRFVQLLLLGLPGLAAALASMVLMVVLVGAAALQVGLSVALSGDGSAPMAIGLGLLLALAVGLLLAMAVFALVVFAVPRVMLDRVDAVTAMKDSLAASLANVGALLVFGLLFIAAFVALLVATMLVGWIPFLGQLAALTAWLAFAVGGIAVSNAGVYLGWRDQWPGTLPAAAVAPPGPPPPLA